MQQPFFFPLSQNRAQPKARALARRSAPGRLRGFTLVELAVAGTIVAVLLTMAVPSVAAFRTQLQLKTATNSLFNSVLFARREALMRNMRVVVCKSHSGAQCAQTGGWEQGWVVFVDTNNNARVDPAEVVLQRQAEAPQVRIVGNSAVSNYVSYTGMGVSAHLSGAFQSGTFTVCSGAVGQVELRKVVISPGGRPRVDAASPGACA
jgi:type IV fimbrial biogenesis protein FimT